MPVTDFIFVLLIYSSPHYRLRQYVNRLLPHPATLLNFGFARLCADRCHMKWARILVMVMLAQVPPKCLYSGYMMKAGLYVRPQRSTYQHHVILVHPSVNERLNLPKRASKHRRRQLRHHNDGCCRPIRQYKLLCRVEV